VSELWVSGECKAKRCQRFARHLVTVLCGPLQLSLRLFQMFVRLFVDENLDRIIPISKQPKEKIQAIIDSCARQFPEFSDRSRKRIRTYLKSCRRNKKTRDGWENTVSLVRTM